jgi:hypothetical protein
MKSYFPASLRLCVFLYFIVFLHKSISVVSERSAHSRSFFACPQRDQGIRSWGSIWLNLCEISLANPYERPWGKKRKMREQEILSKCCSRRPSRNKGMHDGQLCPDSSTDSDWRCIDIQKPLWRCHSF